MPKGNHYTVVIIGTGFGGTMAALSVARAFSNRKKNETLLMLERGTWWTTPVGTVQDKEVSTFDFLVASSTFSRVASAEKRMKMAFTIFPVWGGVACSDLSGARTMESASSGPPGLGAVRSFTRILRFARPILSSRTLSGPSLGRLHGVTPSSTLRAKPSGRVCCGH